MSHTIPSCGLALIVSMSVGGTAAVLASPAAAQGCNASGSPGSERLPTEQTLQEAAMSVMREINRERGARELVRLAGDPRLALAAQRHTRDMVRRRFFSHVTPDGRGMRARVRATGYLWNVAAWALGETLAWGAGPCSTPATTVAAWMASPSHRRVMLSRRYVEIGVGVALGVPSEPAPATGATYAAEFGFVRP
jgi:uncharacterized protein YkwD